MAGRPVVSFVLLALASATGCVEPLGGSNIQLDFASSVQTAARAGQTPATNQPPANTHYTFYATQYTYAADGTTITAATLFNVADFEIKPVIDTGSPCFIDLEETRYPGLHVTQYANRLQADLDAKHGGPVDPFDPATPHNDAVDILTARDRMSHLPLLEGGLKAVVAYSPFRYSDVRATGTAANCSDPNVFPHPSCTDDASNAQRLRLCEEAWKTAGVTKFYEGSDKVFTLPLNGKFFGMVEGMNPINNGFVGGSGMYVTDELVGMDAFLVNWSYNDPAADPLGANASTTGYNYLQGLPRHVARGVINSKMLNLNDARITADLAVFPDLGDDDVHF